MYLFALNIIQMLLTRVKVERRVHVKVTGRL